ncbi:AEC family transporter [Vibrio superstes]|uniref:Transporter n=1 Tax=Vibrio superstes NBRC 103154 TaxID=1219062 RepID=A0A511QRI0_9VIBR|nr:AEC family transporter [Vibrio superstes]GEM79677.1 transporter [Vibrio superstes NBRC 103154]
MSVAQLLHVVFTILPVFLLIGLGFLAAKTRIMPENGHKVLAAFVFNFGLPAAIFSALSTKSLVEIWDTQYLLVYALGSMLAFAVVMGVSVALLKRNLTQSVILGLGGSFSNSLLIGFPIIYFLFGSAALVPFSLTLIVENLIMLPLLLMLADFFSVQSDSSVRLRFTSTLKNLAKNPIVLSIVLGMSVSALSIPTPETASKMIDMLASTVTGVALFTIGGGLIGVRVNGMKKEISTVVLGKLILHPLILLGMILIWFELEPTMGAVAVILASMPMFGIYSVIGQKYKMEGLCSAVLLPTTLLAMVSVSVMTTIALAIFSLN